uniref:Uncharacterized protein n=1 Tax=Arundo donax TaxID=35708 RepID=A0A0A9BHK2_ARUDO
MYNAGIYPFVRIYIWNAPLHICIPAAGYIMIIIKKCKVQGFLEDSRYQLVSKLTKTKCFTNCNLGLPMNYEYR